VILFLLFDAKREEAKDLAKIRCARPEGPAGIF